MVKLVDSGEAFDGGLLPSIELTIRAPLAPRYAASAALPARSNTELRGSPLARNLVIELIAGAAVAATWCSWAPIWFASSVPGALLAGDLVLAGAAVATAALAVRPARSNSELRGSPLTDRRRARAPHGAELEHRTGGDWRDERWHG